MFVGPSDNRAASDRGSAQVIALLALIVSLIAVIMSLVAIMQVNRPRPSYVPVTESRSYGEPEPVPTSPPPIAQVESDPPATQPAAPQPLDAPPPTPPSAVESKPVITPEPVVASEPIVTPEPDAAVGEPYIVPAGRSPIPGEGEMVTAPIPPKRLEPEPIVAASDAYEVVPWTAAKEHLDQIVTVEGRIVNTNNIGHITFLNFHEDWRDKFYVVIFDQAYEDVPGGKPEAYYLNKTIRATGEVRLRNGRPQMQVRDVKQLEVVE